MTLTYNSISNATLSTVLTELATSGIGPTRILNIFWNGSAYVAVYTKEL